MRGWTRSRESLDRALELGAVDEACESVEEAVTTSDICFVCTSVGALSRYVRDALEAGGDCVVTDVGSVKQALNSELHSSGLPQADLQRFIGGHPLAGAEASGVEHARADLFAGATWYLTPSETSSGVLYERLYRTIAKLGAHPTAIDAATHDRMMATVSHLPHVLANVLVSQAARALADESQTLPATGPSFRDAARVAGANPPLWHEIFMGNRQALIAEIENYTDALRDVRKALDETDGESLDGWIEQARADRHRLLESELAGGPVSELHVSVPNKPGIVAQVSLALGEAGVNIVDMALYPAADMQSGAITLWVSGASAASRAVKLIGELGYPASVVADGEG